MVTGAGITVHSSITRKMVIGIAPDREKHIYQVTGNQHPEVKPGQKAIGILTVTQGTGIIRIETGISSSGALFNKFKL